MSALTEGELTEIRHALGYPQVFLYANPRLEDALSRATAYVADKARVLLIDIADAKAKLKVALGSAGLKSLDKGDVELYPGNQQIQGARDSGRQACSELSILFGVPIANDIFGKVGYAGSFDTWMIENGRPTIAGLG